MSKLVLVLIFLSLAFAVCVSTVLRLNSDERLSTLLTFLVATLVDTLLFRPAVIIVVAFYDFLEIRAVGWKNMLTAAKSVT
jgi:sugar phosphate permease